MVKVFGIGLSKTGTSSLSTALKKLGYRTRHYPELYKVVELSREFDALTDSPVVPYIETLDRLYPEAKFILTIRDVESWLVSCDRHYQIKPLHKIMRWKLHNRRANFGIETFDEKIFRQVYHDHMNRVTKLFQSPDKLLILDICGGEGYEKLCPFLGKKTLKEKFPYENRAKKSA
jgi:hypothetical protein